MLEQSARGFFGSLYDLTFHSFVTPKIVQILYVLSLIVVGLISLYVLVSGFQPSYGPFGNSYPSPTSIIGHLVLAPILFIFGSLAARMYLEFVVAVFRIAENTESLRRREEP